MLNQENQKIIFQNLLTPTIESTHHNTQSNRLLVKENKKEFNFLYCT